VAEVVGDDEVRAPLPVKRETLYGDASFVRCASCYFVMFPICEKATSCLLDGFTQLFGKYVHFK